LGRIEDQQGPTFQSTLDHLRQNNGGNPIILRQVDNWPR
jgi:hypothetical protein